jgi:hypothetical protein
MHGCVPAVLQSSQSPTGQRDGTSQSPSRAKMHGSPSLVGGLVSPTFVGALVGEPVGDAPVLAKHTAVTAR